MTCDNIYSLIIEATVLYSGCHSAKVSLNVDGLMLKVMKKKQMPLHIDILLIPDGINGCFAGEKKSTNSSLIFEAVEM